MLQNMSETPQSSLMYSIVNAHKPFAQKSASNHPKHSYSAMHRQINYQDQSKTSP